jgi:hypothetical protein
MTRIKTCAVLGVKPELNASEAFHRLAPREGQKENEEKKEVTPSMGKRGGLKPHASWKGERTGVGLDSRKKH